MSSESAYQKGHCIRNRCQTQRKIIKNQPVKVISSIKNKFRKNKPESLSVRNNKKMLKNRQKIKENTKKNIDFLILANKQTKNITTGTENANFQKNQVQSFKQITNLIAVKLKVKRKKPIQSIPNQIPKIKQKLKNIQGPKQKDNLNSLHLKSTNFQVAQITEQIDSPKMKVNRKRLTSLKMLQYKVKATQKYQPQKRKKIQSCKFVVNPFDQLNFRQIKKIKMSKPRFEQDEKNNQQFTGQNIFNDISEIRHSIETQQSWMEGMSVQMIKIEKR